MLTQVRVFARSDDGLLAPALWCQDGENADDFHPLFLFVLSTYGGRMFGYESPKCGCTRLAVHPTQLRERAGVEVLKFCGRINCSG